MRRGGAVRPHKRDGIWYLVRRVPKEFEHLDKREIVRVSTEIAVADDPRGIRATQKVKQLSAELDAYWRGMRDGKEAEARDRYDNAVARARKLGIPYQTNQELADGPLELILKRIDTLVEAKALDDEGAVAAVMGGEEKPAIRLDGLVDAYAKIIKTTLDKKSDNQRRKWRNPKIRAVDNLMKSIQAANPDLSKDDVNKPITKLLRTDATTFRLWWQSRIENEGLEIDTANKDIGHISKMLTGVDIFHQLGLPPVFQRLRIEGGKAGQRAAFEQSWIQEKILATGALDALNAEARAIVYLVAFRGCRPSEMANLLPQTIFLKAPIPFVRVKAVGRDIKTDDSERDVPLDGFSLEVMQLFPDGFPRYRDKEDSLSNLVNDYFRLRGWLPTDNHSFYSLRHSFEDRLTDVEAPEKVTATLMGHKWHRPKYGKGPSLQQKLRWLRKIDFKPPAHFGPLS